jgi:pimeloyl-ACP methyl ester carboxylesterase
MSSEGIVTVGRERFAYLADGDERAPLVLCLHGFPDHPPSFRPLMARLAAAGWRAVAPWMRGYAPSTLSGPFHSAQLAADLAGLADALAPGKPVRLVGHDWGAIATYAALGATPERFASALTLSVPHLLAFLVNLQRDPEQLRRSWYIAFFQLPLIPERVVPRRNFAFVDRLWRTWSPGLTPDPDDMAALKRCLAASMPAPIAYYRALRDPRSLARRAITTPVLHLTGSDDGCIGPELGERQAGFFAGPFRSDIIRGAGHFLPLEAPDAIADAAQSWFGAP